MLEEVTLTCQTGRVAPEAEYRHRQPLLPRPPSARRGCRLRRTPSPEPIARATAEPRVRVAAHGGGSDELVVPGELVTSNANSVPRRTPRDRDRGRCRRHDSHTARLGRCDRVWALRGEEAGLTRGRLRLLSDRVGSLGENCRANTVRTRSHGCRARRHDSRDRRQAGQRGS